MLVLPWTLQTSGHVQRKLKQRLQSRKLDQHLADQFTTGRLMACISSRPGQSGRCDGYLLEGEWQPTEWSAPSTGRIHHASNTSNTQPYCQQTM